MSGTITNEDVSGAFETMEALGRLSAPEAIVGRLAKYLERYGFTSFLVSGLPSQNERLEPYILLNSWPKACVRHCFSTVEPFTWSELPGPLLEGRRAKLIMGDAADCGLVEGMCVPLHDVYGFQAVVTMAGDKIEVPPNARKLVHLTSLYAFGAAERAIRPSPPTQRLTEREREIMSWTAAGKTAWEIGEVLGIAQATVAAHMMHIREKLGTQNAAHSVAEALRRREIRL